MAGHKKVPVFGLRNSILVFDIYTGRNADLSNDGQNGGELEVEKDVPGLFLHQFLQAGLHPLVQFVQTLVVALVQ